MTRRAAHSKSCWLRKREQHWPELAEDLITNFLFELLLRIKRSFNAGPGISERESVRSEAIGPLRNWYFGSVPVTRMGNTAIEYPVPPFSALEANEND